MEKRKLCRGKNNGLRATETRLYFNLVLASLCLSLSNCKVGTFANLETVVALT